MLPNRHQVVAPSILFVDDDPDELFLAEECFAELGLCGIRYFTDAASLVAYMEALPAGAPLPRLIISDLNMPGTNGLGLLRQLKSAPRYQNIPVIIYSTSSYARHREECIREGATDFKVKPNSFRQMLEVFRSYGQSLLPV